MHRSRAKAGLTTKNRNYDIENVNVKTGQRETESSDTPTSLKKTGSLKRLSACLYYFLDQISDFYFQKVISIKF